MGSRNEDRSFSTMGASGVAIAPHIRDALEQARLAAQESEAPREPLMEAPSFPKPASETARDAEDLRKALERANAVEGDLSRALLKVSSSGRRESSLVNRLAEKEKQLARDQLKADNASLAQQLREAKEWNDNLEQEREDLYHLLDEAKSGNGAAMGRPKIARS
ncbi:hypothetical protein JL720_15645 [Aureococcus anophagefferens]|nr:hypothetical protein JL720_15645 [Aureococcus anophagefferens]